MNRAEFLGRISQRLGRTSPNGQAPERDVAGVPDFWEKFRLDPQAQRARFAERLTSLGGEVRIVSNVASLQETLTEVMAGLTPRRIGMWNDAQLMEWVSPSLSGYDVFKWGVHPADEFTTIDVGLTGCTWAVADTGTLALSCSEGRGRSVHLLPPVHIAVVGASQFVTRIGEVFKRLPSGGHLDPYLHFVTGPSRSSDIENDQSIGVHGPAAEMVVVVESL